jgi:hypothetical protein
MMRALEAVDGILLFGIGTAYILKSRFDLGLEGCRFFRQTAHDRAAPR